jgi:hypothetical protein
MKHETRVPHVRPPQAEVRGRTNGTSLFFRLTPPQIRMAEKPPFNAKDYAASAHSIMVTKIETEVRLRPCSSVPLTLTNTSVRLRASGRTELRQEALQNQTSRA